MIKINWVAKLTSRKFWITVCSFASMFIVFIGYSDSQATKITSLIMAGASVVAYIIGEGLVDSSSTSNSISTTSTTTTVTTPKE